jgi:chromosome segregation ATPase
MSIVVAALAVVGGVIFILFVVLSYTSESTRLKGELRELVTHVEAMESKTRDYEGRIVSLQGEIPVLKARCDRLTRWIDLLKRQKSQVAAEKGNLKEMGSKEARMEAVRQGLAVNNVLPLKKCTRG